MFGMATHIRKFGLPGVLAKTGVQLPVDENKPAIVCQQSETLTQNKKRRKAR